MSTLSFDLSLRKKINENKKKSLKPVYEMVIRHPYACSVEMKTKEKRA